MKRILILASGSIARNFISAIGNNRVAENSYYVTCHKLDLSKEDRTMAGNITFIDEDPTSYFRLSKILGRAKFSNIFIVMEDREDVEYIIKNLTLYKCKIHTILVDQWSSEEMEVGELDEYFATVHVDSLIASHLYNQLPNVPLIAQNIGLGHGEVMEIHVPVGSAYAYRHIGSILQRKWRITALYRNEKLILPNNATMIKPNDTLLIVGKPMVLDGVYRSINKRMGLFPEPFGRNIYLLLDFRFDRAKAIAYIEEARYLLGRLEHKELYIHVIYPNDFDLLDEVKSYEGDRVFISVSYSCADLANKIEFNINNYEIGLIMSSMSGFNSDQLQERLYHMRKIVYLFGDTRLAQSQKAVILIGEKHYMESISATAFDVSEKFNLILTLCDFDPEGEFENKEMSIKHYETLTEIFNREIQIKQKMGNPIRELSKIENFLQIIPFEEALNTHKLKTIFSSDPKDFILTSHKHPKLLVPFAD
jgi:hypothetical protein